MNYEIEFCGENFGILVIIATLRNFYSRDFSFTRGRKGKRKRGTLCIDLGKISRKPKPHTKVKMMDRQPI